MRILIATALDGSTITYGELGAKLEEEAGFSTIFRTRIGWLVGTLMEEIQSANPDAPLLNVLVVNQQDRQPSRGAGSFMAKRFKDGRLKEANAKKNHPELWGQNFERAAAEVYQYSEREWAALYRRVFGRSISNDTIDEERKNRKGGEEKDGIQTGRNYGAGGEGPFHKALRIWVKDNPSSISKSFAEATTETEVDLDSGDRIDVVYKLAGRTVVLEVKSRVSNEIDLRRGVFQCVKYRAVRAAMDVRSNPTIEAYLVTEEELPGEIAQLVKLHDVRHYLAPKDRL
jgi:hypothetical protein